MTNRMNPNDIKKQLEEAGIPVTIITIKRTKRMEEIEKAVKKYVLFIEEAHKKAAKSTLHFGSKAEALALSAPFLFYVPQHRRSDE